ncbi:MAG: SagB/ThcOx family dehydrogenase [Prolixibacteraceae bacterium]|nr:SagB/ThcOx family dehydrogenase [Prolixibacteraceae bacterium]
MKTLILILGIMIVSQTISAQDITLPKPKKTGGIPLMEALSKRSSHREFSKEEIDNQTLSNLLWAAWGYNREGMRTAPSANNKQCIDLYVVKKSGAYRYDALNNKLIQVNSEDVRKNAGKQEFVWEAPLNFIYVADKEKGGWPQTDCGFIAQNVYLFCASENLVTVVRGFFDVDDVKKALKLKDNQETILTQTIGKRK